LKTITHVKVIGGQVIDLTTKPSLDAHYEIHDDVLYLVPEDVIQRSQAILINTKSLGTIIAKGFSYDEVNIEVPYEFIKYKSWCSSIGFKASDPQSLSRYFMYGYHKSV
jgi:hypothetical protein